MKNFKSQWTLFLDCKKRNSHKIFYLTAKLIASDSDIDEVFKLIYQSIITKLKNYASEYWII